MLNSKIPASGINVSNLKWLWQTEMVQRHKSHNLTWSTTCLFVCLPYQRNCKKLFCSSPGRKNHVLIEKLCCLMLRIYKGDELPKCWCSWWEDAVRSLSTARWFVSVQRHRISYLPLPPSGSCTCTCPPKPSFITAWKSYFISSSPNSQIFQGWFSAQSLFSQRGWVWAQTFISKFRLTHCTVMIMFTVLRKVFAAAVAECMWIFFLPLLWLQTISTADVCFLQSSRLMLA